MFFMMLVYIVFFIIRPQDYPAVAEGAAPPYQQIALLMAGGFWLFARHKRTDSPQHILLFAFYIVLMLSSMANGWFGGALVQLEKFGPALLAFFVLAAGLDSASRMRTVMATFCLCAVVLAVHGIEQASVGIGWTGVGLSQGTRIQYVGVFNDPNDLGMLFVMCIPMALYLSGQGGLMGLRRLVWLAVAIVLGWGIVLTNSRGTMLAVLVMLGVYLWKVRGPVYAGIIASFSLVGLLMLPSRMQDMDVSEASAMGRVESWYEGLQMFRSAPFLGIGPDRYSDHYNLTAHNSFVLVLAETGVIGFTLWLAFVIYCFQMMRVGLTGSAQAMGYGESEASTDVMPEDTDPDVEEESMVRSVLHEEDRRIALTLFVSLAGFFTCAFFLSRSYLILPYLLAAMAVAHYACMRRNAPDLPMFTLGRDFLRWPIVVAVAIVGFFVLVKILLVTA